MTPIHIQWADDGQHIRKWAHDPFAGSTEYAAIATPIANIHAVTISADSLRELVDQSALASAPAGDAFADAGKPIAPAGDGVDAATRMMRDCADDLVSTASHHGQYAAIDQDKIDGLRDAVRDYDAALARPRAAVGERNSVLELAAQEAYRVCAETRHITLGDKTRDAILAMRLPPPKVEPTTLALVIAARQFWDIHNDLTTESKALDTALEPFAATVPYADDPSIVTRYYLRDFSDEVCPCDPTLEGWAKWLAEPDEEFNREVPAVDGERFAASTLVFDQDVIATRCVEGWTFDPPLEGYDFYALRFGPGAGWSCDDIADSITVLKEMLDDQLPLDPGTTMNIAVAHNGADVTVLYHSGPPPSCTVDDTPTD